MSNAETSTEAASEFSPDLIAPLLTILRQESDPNVVSETIKTLAAQPLGVDTWRAVGASVLSILENDADPQVVEAAAVLPTEQVRSALRQIAHRGDDATARAAERGLIAAGDVDTIVAAADELQRAGDWKALAELPPAQLEHLALDADLGGDGEEDTEPWRSITFAKAGRVRPLADVLDKIENDEGPSLFWGDPEYVASLLKLCQPVPAAVRALLEAELASIDRNEQSDRFREVAILVAGLTTSETFEEVMYR